MIELDLPPLPDETVGEPNGASRQSSKSEEHVAYRVLAPDEIRTLAPVFAAEGVSLPDSRFSAIVGAVKGGVVIGFVVLQLRLHAEPMWIEQGHSDIFLPLRAAAELTIKERVGECDVFLFAPAGKVSRLAQVSGMRMEPWCVFSKHIKGEAPAAAVPDDVVDMPVNIPTDKEESIQ